MLKQPWLRAAQDEPPIEEVIEEKQDDSHLGEGGNPGGFVSLADFYGVDPYPKDDPDPVPFERFRSDSPSMPTVAPPIQYPMVVEGDA